jgi:Rieske Fe-S protein
MTTSMTRRSVLTGAVVSVIGGVVGFIVASNTDAANNSFPRGRAPGYGSNATGSSAARRGTAPPPSPRVWLASVAKVPQGGGVIDTSHKVVVTKDTTGALHCFSAVCPHLGCLVGSVSGGTINCPCHGSKFNATTGAVVQGPATTSLATEPFTVKGGNVYLGSTGRRTR